MARREKGVRVLGPYEHRRRFRLIVVGDGGEQVVESYETEAKARQVKRAILRRLAGEGVLTLEQALERYEKHLQIKGNKQRSIDTTRSRIAMLFGDTDVPMSNIDAGECEHAYGQLQAKVAVDTHRNVLAEAKTFGAWCVKQRIWAPSPLAGLEGVGKRRKGKKQLRIDEARRWLDKAIFYAERGEAGAVAAMTTLLMSLRAGEVVERVVRDLDDEGRLLWIDDAKTEAGKRKVKVPAVLQPYLRKLAVGNEPHALLFGKHWRDWPRKWVQRICREAGVPLVTAHGMRGLHATLAEEAGETPEAVARTLGHESTTTTHAHYTQASAADGARQRRVLKVLAGGAA